MERARVLRFLRYAVTALSVTACVLLVAMWVRSYWWVTNIQLPQKSRYYQLVLKPAGVSFNAVAFRDWDDDAPNMQSGIFHYYWSDPTFDHFTKNKQAPFRIRINSNEIR